MMKAILRRENQATNERLGRAFQDGDIITLVRPYNGENYVFIEEFLDGRIAYALKSKGDVVNFSFKYYYKCLQ